MRKFEKCYNDEFHRTKNRIPYCERDAKELFDSKVSRRDNLTIGRSIFQAMSETAENFMMAVLNKPYQSDFKERSMLPKVMLANVKEKFPEIA